jgi:hypothetical protein
VNSGGSPLDQVTYDADRPLLITERQYDVTERLPIENAVLFCDFDGVLNSARWIHTVRHRESRSDRMVREIDPANVGYLNQLIDRSGARVVISSSWRKLGDYDPQLFQIELQTRGFIGQVIGCTPTFGTERGHEIQKWIDDNGHTGPFVILDDSSDMAHLMPYLVRTKWEFGLQQEHVDQALEVLMRSSKR